MKVSSSTRATHRSAPGLVRAHRSGDPETLLTEHHQETENACLGLLGCTYADDRRVLIEQFRVFDRELREHLAVEEAMLLPRYAQEAPEDASHLFEDHALIRQLLDRLGVDVELHTVRAAMIDELVAVLRAHAAREEVGMYPWEQVHLDAPGRSAIRTRISQSLRRLSHPSARRSRSTSP